MDMSEWANRSRVLQACLNLNLGGSVQISLNTGSLSNTCQCFRTMCFICPAAGVQQVGKHSLDVLCGFGFFLNNVARSVLPALSHAFKISSLWQPSCSKLRASCEVLDVKSEMVPQFLLTCKNWSQSVPVKGFPVYGGLEDVVFIIINSSMVKNRQLVVEFIQVRKLFNSSSVHFHIKSTSSIYLRHSDRMERIMCDVEYIYFSSHKSMTKPAYEI